ncbi:MAG TPA: UDP-glucose/GDP-mannose dehydrogenase family protein [Ramlibacter sp.]|uniref:UDP-glucose dehydrogenase family protein n=1 Tax=Ramlibacter sp. TaxID=1917967 RepID=UPI002B7900D1|nr:UDP-glucose/GDP-mannose dehydrogenase family protein [Ramlibacter sp.]HVZ43036.1 UDP-glucose/GDP-mannose dehydrogenase family protein [Ramlibacter sp.]
MKVTVIGTGYVGLVTGACLADVGNEVMCLDVDPARIAALKDGIVPIHEPGLPEIVGRCAAGGRLHFTTDTAEATAFAELQLICVGTPPDEDGSADLRYVLAAARSIAEHAHGYKAVVTKSTVPVGTGDRVAAALREVLESRGLEADFDVASNPEFLKEGAAVEDFMRPDRIVVGADTQRMVGLLRQLYAPFQRNHERMVVMDVKSAELTKYAANAMLATRISFMNEMANLAELLGADIEMVRKGIGSDPRIGFDFLYPGCGYGGSCFPKDVQALLRLSHGHEDGELRVLDAVHRANAAQKQVLPRKVLREFGGDIRGKRIAIWGLAFKPNTDDMREAPSRDIVRTLLDAGASISAYDPVARKEAERVMAGLPRLTLADSAMEAATGADALVVVTEWKEFRSPDFAQLKSVLKRPLVFDGRNIFDPATMRQLGFRYFGIGRP